MTDGMTKIGARLAVLAMIGFGASACSSIPDWVDPTNWGGGASDSEEAAGETPDLATLPDRPTPTSTAAEQQEVSQSLDADRTRAKYSADALRGGTEAEAAPPPPPSALSQQQIAAAQRPAPPPAAPPPAPAVSPDAGTVTVPQGNDTQTAAAPSPAPAPEAAPLPPAPAPAMETPPPAPQSTMPPPAAPVASPPPPARTAVASFDPSDAALGFRPSTAPPLDPSVGQFVPAPIISRYQQTSSSQVASLAPARGAVAASTSVSAQPSVYANATGGQPSSVVYFPGDGTLLNAEGRAQVRAAVQAFKKSGGQGYIRVVGHASSRTSNMPVEKHLEVIFDKSQDRANAVAKEMIREGVPANRVLVEAVGDSQPVYYESMPKGEDGNRRAEIFLQG